jgi:hypothetical protein
MLELLAIIAEYGWQAFVIFLFAVILGKHFIERLKDKSDKINPHTPEPTLPNLNDDLQLKYHVFFSTAQYKLISEIPNLILSKTLPIRQALFRDILYINIKNIYEVCQEIANTDMSTWNSQQWSAEIIKKLGTITEGFNKDARNEGIPDEVISKFTNWNLSNIEMLYDYVDTIGSSSAYPNVGTKTTTLFLIMNLLVVSTIADAEKTLISLNGDISGKMYKGQVIEPYDYSINN